MFMVRLSVQWTRSGTLIGLKSGQSWIERHQTLHPAKHFMFPHVYESRLGLTSTQLLEGASIVATNPW